MRFVKNSLGMGTYTFENTVDFRYLNFAEVE